MPVYQLVGGQLRDAADGQTSRGYGGKLSGNPLRTPIVVPVDACAGEVGPLGS